MRLGLPLILLAACSSTLSPAASMVRDIDKPNAGGCQFLGIVSGSSSQTGVANKNTGMLNAHNEAREQAADRGANYIAWTSENASFMSIDVQGEAYRCP